MRQRIGDFMVDKVIEELDDFLERMDLAEILEDFTEAMLEGDIEKAAEIISDFTNGNVDLDEAKQLANEIWSMFENELREMYG
mgnify:CR=1 FL=1